MNERFSDPVAAHGWESSKSFTAGDRRQPPSAIAAWRQVDQLAGWLGEAIAAAARAEPAASSAAEWLLDNGYQVQRAMMMVKKDLPPGFYAKLRALVAGTATGEPRVHMLAHDLLHACHFQLSADNVLAYLDGYQTEDALDIAELWAFPTMLRIACLERLVSGFAVAFPAVREPFKISACAEHFLRSCDAADCVGRAIANLAVISGIRWEEMFDRSSRIEGILARDPSNTYRKMDFETRDACRRAVEGLAELANTGEIAVAEAALAMADGHATLPARHIGYWLIGSGFVELERELGVIQPFIRRLGRWLLRRPGGVYVIALFLCGAGGLALPMTYLAIVGAEPRQWLLGLAFAALPATVLSVTLVNWVVTLCVPPRQLPKLDFRDGIDPAWPTVVAMPVIIGSVAEVNSVLARLASHRLANPGARSYALLSDPVDAATENTGSDRKVERALRTGIAKLNRQHSGGFCLMHRARRFNPVQGCWMAWERKRGKIEEFNRFILTGDRSAFVFTVGKIRRIVGARFVVVADADTRLPPGSVARLAGTLAHPLNRPVSDDQGRVIAGYTVLQPRVELAPHSSETLFARLFGGDTAIDIYSRAVSDVYQDLIGTGNYVGKGIYDVAAFAASVEGRIPENQLLSHDLWEGLHGRVGLVSDIIVYESFPASYAEYTRRWHRWVRGDWQLIPWLLPRVNGSGGTRLANRLTLFDRLRIWDNMRRSLVPASVLLLLLGGWFMLPGSPLFWTALGLLVPSAWLFTDLVTGVARGRRRGVLTSTLRQSGEHLQRWALQLVFLVSDTATSLHAIFVTLWRLICGNRLLEWTSAAHITGLLERNSVRAEQAKATWPAPLFAMTLLPWLIVDGAALASALPLLVMWILAPEIALWTAKPRRQHRAPLDLEARQYLRLIARRSWLFFERFAGPEDHWLPPDNHQEAPVGATAHRTSPTNVGMMALSALAAWRFGHLGVPEFVGRMTALLDTLDRLDRWNGHVYNWYDTRSLASLEPRYVSTVDSGNLAVSLIVLANGCRAIASTTAFHTRRWDGLVDCLQLLAEAIRSCKLPRSISVRLAGLQDRIAGRDPNAQDWPKLLKSVSHEASLIRKEVIAALDQESGIELSSLQELHDWFDRSDHHLEQCGMELDGRLKARPQVLRSGLDDIAQRARKLAEGMDFKPLYNQHRKLFHIGYNVTIQRIDGHFYDLLASEARLASYFAIAKRDVSPEHWSHLGRPIMKHRRQLALVSWNGSMFEYLMPSLFLRSDPSTLLGETETAAVAVQRRFADERRVPWGISESGFASSGSDGVWRYRAFGVPALGLRRGLDNDLVIAPYATALALCAAPREAVENLRRLAACGALGRYGFFEALDFTRERRKAGGEPAAVNSYMSHHHGMTIAAIVNALEDDLIVRWFHADDRMGSVDLLLNERIPWELPAELDRLEHAVADTDFRADDPLPPPWELDPPVRPKTWLLGNGRLTLRMASDGCGDLLWKNHEVTCPPGRNRTLGQFISMRDRASGRIWSPTSASTGSAQERRIVAYPHKLQFRCRTDDISSSLELFISPAQDVEIRRIRLVNGSPKARLVDVATHADIALAETGEWSRHPAFARLFIECENRSEIDTLVFSRRVRDPDAQGLVMAQRLVRPPDFVRIVGCEVSRRLSRGRFGGLDRFPELKPCHGPIEPFPLDAAAVFLCEVTLPAYGEVELALVTTLAPVKSEALELAQRYGSLAALEWADQDAANSLRRDLQAIGLAPARLRDTDLIFSAVMAEAVPRMRIAGVVGREDLWGLGLSGDLPIVLVELHDQFDEAEASFMLAAHRLWRWRGARIDLVFLYPGFPGYVEPLRDRLLDLVRAGGSEEHLGKQGGIVLVGSDHGNEQRIAALRIAAAVTIIQGRGPIEKQLRDHEVGPMQVPAFIPTEHPKRQPNTAAISAAAGGPPHLNLMLDNTIGGFTAAGDYAIALPARGCTPAPWANVLANPTFGTIVTEAGLGFTFAGNSGENRLTPWHNDALLDPPAEALFLRDEETGHVWSVTPLPAGREEGCTIEHGLGETRWSRESMELVQDMRCFVPEDDPLKIITLRLQNRSAVPRRITATFFADWLLGANSDEPAPFRSSWFEPHLGAVLGSNRAQRDFAGRLAFVAGTLAVHSFTTSRSEFLGSPPDWQTPAGLLAWGLGDRLENQGADAAAAIQFHLDIAAEGSVELGFLMGQANDENQLEALLLRWRSSGAIACGRQDLARYWTRHCGALQVKTADAAFDIMVNRWLPYQTMASRLHARAGYYQASGAFGFRDQLQDVLAVLISNPQLARRHILEAAAHQFEQGDVLHWWHPPSSKGVRTRCSDDLLWLPYAVARYVSATADTGILDEQITFLSAGELTDDEHDRFAEFPRNGSASLVEHCNLALERGFRLGTHGLPLIGDGDWNDGMNRVGADGKGESVWLAWFMAATIRDFASLCKTTGREDIALRWLSRSAQLIEAAERHAWDGAWYVRAFDDQGRPWGSSSNDECQIDALAQSWAVMAGADSARARRAVDSAFEQLVSPGDPIARLLAPPFDRSARDPGYIKAYPPGIRENGGQYSHASAWLGIACAMLGDGARAKAVFDRINPVLHSGTAERAGAYLIEPYAVAGDISGGAHLGRGGWSWYTGAAGWAWRLATEHILGIRLESGQFVLEPCLPPEWQGFSATLQGDGTIEIAVERAASPRYWVDGQDAVRGPISYPGMGKTMRIELALAPHRTTEAPAGTAG